MARGTSKKSTSSTRSRSDHRRGSTPLPTLGTPSRTIPQDKPTPQYGGGWREWLAERRSPSGPSAQVDRMFPARPHGISELGQIIVQRERQATGGSRRSPSRPRRGGR